MLPTNTTDSPYSFRDGTSSFRSQQSSLCCSSSSSGGKSLPSSYTSSSSACTSPISEYTAEEEEEDNYCLPTIVEPTPAASSSSSIRSPSTQTSVDVDVDWALSHGRILSIHRESFIVYLDVLRVTQPSVPTYRLVEEGNGSCTAYSQTALSMMRGLVESYRPAESMQLKKLYRSYLEQNGILLATAAGEAASSSSSPPRPTGRWISRKRSFLTLAGLGGIVGKRRSCSTS